MDLAGRILEGRLIRIEPLNLIHATDLSKAGNSEMFRYTYGPEVWTKTGLEDYITEMNQLPRWVCFGIIALESNKAIGVTCYLDIRTDHKRVEIGSTWISPEYQGKNINTEAKYLMLHDFFEILGGQRVQIKTDPRNRRSVGAIEKVGFIKEGVLRRHMILSDGSARDSVMYSMIDTEWVEKKVHIENLLGYSLF